MLNFNCTAEREGDKQAIGSKGGASVWNFCQID